MATYLIDFENVGSDGLNGVEQLTEKDTVVIFYSTNSNRISIEMHRIICKSSAVFEYQEITVGGRNALDFQLSTYLGFLLSQNNNDTFFIISKDHGFEHVIKFWTNMMPQYNLSTEIIRQNMICLPVEKIETTEENMHLPPDSDISEDTQNCESVINDTICESQDSLNDVAKVIISLDNIVSKTNLQKQLKSELGNEQGVCIYKYINHNLENKTKQDFHKNLVAQFGQKNGSAVYNKLKKLVRK